MNRLQHWLRVVALLCIGVSAWASCGGDETTGTTTGNTTSSSSSGMACLPPNAQCGTDCVDVATDEANCGACGMACPAGGTCTMGACACDSATAILCGTSCVEPSTDTQNCGACGINCGSGGTCAMGLCNCAAGLVDCGSGCFDLSADPQNCGLCGNHCATGAACTSEIPPTGSGPESTTSSLLP